MTNTPPVFSVYTTLLNLRWIESQGGIEELEKRNIKKAELLYNEIDRNIFFKGYAAKEDRSSMNVTFELTNENNLHADSASADDNTFKNADEGTNRFILELEFHPKPKQNDIIFDRTPYGSALSAELSNT